MKLIRKNQEGFTLVELMVVVAIIGILAAIAIPNYQKYQAKARQSEAKLTLGSIHTALTAYAAEASSYTACLRAAGYEPEGLAAMSSRRYYASGFSVAAVTAGAMACGPVGGQACTFFSWDTAGTGINGCTGVAGAFAAADGDNETQYNATFSAQPGFAMADDAQLGAITPVTAITNVGFTAGAAGNVSTGTAGYDNWTIDNSKNMQNVQPVL
jgi:type IV pilus assembly protein PilA